MLLVAKVQFQQANGRLSKAYDYTVDRELGKTLRKGDWVVVTSFIETFACAMFAGVAVLTNPGEIDKVTQKVICEIPTGGVQVLPNPQVKIDEYIDI